LEGVGGKGAAADAANLLGGDELRFLEQSPAGALYQRIPSAPVRLLWRLVNATPMRNYDVLNRFAF